MVDDWSEWLEELEGVKPLKGKKKPEISTKKGAQGAENTQLEPEKPADTDPVEVEKHPSAAERLLARFQKPKSYKQGMHHQDISRTDHMSATRASVDEKVRRRLMQGNFSIDARLDLHGLTVDEARRRTEDILERCHRSGARCLLLVHGKGVGYGEKGNMGAIKAQVTDWLIASPHVLAFHSAKPKHGGVGALYVLIRRPRD